MLGASSFAMLGGSSLMLGGSSVTKAYGTNYKMYGVKQFLVQAVLRTVTKNTYRTVNCCIQYNNHYF